MRKVSVLIGFLLLVGLVLTLVAQEQDLPPIMKEVPPTMASRGRRRSCPTAMERRRNTVSHRSSRCPVQGWVSSGSMAGE